ncbi:hypothetical protein [uncultured Roseibium sp.]|uniref:hypothetical protein n=1 Tax=uncultured Roseibium sp. TaxID=1936171 RepID=UPI00262AAEB7|nr:hypothetical protein [uncultured Roseibium sp.]
MTAKKQIFVRISSLGIASSFSQCHHRQNPQLNVARDGKFLSAEGERGIKAALLTRRRFLIFVWRLIEVDESRILSNAPHSRRGGQLRLTWWSALEAGAPKQATGRR